MVMIKWTCACFLCLFLSFSISAQTKATIKGKVLDELGKPLEFANVGVFYDGKSIGVITDTKGNFQIIVPAEIPVSFKVTFTGYHDVEEQFTLKADEILDKQVVLKTTIKDVEGVTIYGETQQRSTLVVVDPEIVKVIPTLSGSVEGVLKTFAGVNSSNEMTSQYSVRGGNFDENLIYVNDVEVYRPMLVRSGEQEGLSFINPDLISTIRFSAGGFEAKYGDKMSSVLDIQYKKPTTFGGSFSLDLTGGSFHLEGLSKHKKWSYLFGLRQKSNQYVLKSVGPEGDYRPSFTDVQGLLNYALNKKISFSVFGNISRNVLNVVPESKETKFGSQNDAKRFSVYYDGQEVDKYLSYFGSLSLIHQPKVNIENKFSFSTYHSKERETYDVLGSYLLDDAHEDQEKLSKDEVLTMGWGSYLEHARNYLDILIMNFNYKTSVTLDKQHWTFGLKYEYQDIIDYLNEWKLVDSADYSLPDQSTPWGDTNPIAYYPLVNNRYFAENHVQINTINGFCQNTMRFGGEELPWQLTVGLRFFYWDYSKEFGLSPRASVSYKPYSNKNTIFRFATGYYYQNPFYREFRDITGHLNSDIKSQKSIHFILGNDYEFEMWSRPFKLTTEVYYKYLDDLIPYEVDNLRIRYFGQNCGTGYTTGIDLRLNGEWVKGVDSWLGLSFMRSRENITYQDESGITRQTGYIPTPTDQAVVFNLFFQDYLMNNKNIKANVNLVFGTGLPYGNVEAFSGDMEMLSRRGDFRLPPYQRVDMGFSFLLKGESKQWPKKNPFHFIHNIWLTAELFNVFDIRNTISYMWIADVSGQQYAVANYLTPRLLNVRLAIDF